MKRPSPSIGQYQVDLDAILRIGPPPLMNNGGGPYNGLRG